MVYLWTYKSLYVQMQIIDHQPTNEREIMNPWDDHPVFTPEDWQAEVAAGDTRRGYQDWVESQREQLEDSVKQRLKGMTNDV